MDLPEYLGLCCWVSWLLFTMGGKIEKSHGGAPPGPRGRAEAGMRRGAPNGGRSGAPRARWCAPVWFFNFTTIVKTKSRYSAKKFEILSQIHATQPKITSLYSDIAVLYPISCFNLGDIVLYTRSNSSSQNLSQSTKHKSLSLLLILFQYKFFKSKERKLLSLPVL